MTPDAILLLTAILFVYFLPWVLANLRHTHNQTGILILNLLFGWTAIGWLVAFFMACGSRSV